MVNYTPWNLRRQILLEEQVIRALRVKQSHLLLLFFYYVSELSNKFKMFKVCVYLNIQYNDFFSF